jgi:hypothetical protein
LPSPPYTPLRVFPLTLAQANAYVSQHHRHHKPSVGHKWSVGIEDAEGTLRGVAIAGRPVSRILAAGRTIEVNRCCTDGVPNGCSLLYGACRRIAKDMGYDHIITYILETEAGTSLKAAGWTLEAVTEGGAWKYTGQDRKNDFPLCKKHRYGARLQGPP